MDDDLCSGAGCPDLIKNPGCQRKNEPGHGRHHAQGVPASQLYQVLDKAIGISRQPEKVDTAGRSHRLKSLWRDQSDLIACTQEPSTESHKGLHVAARTVRHECDMHSSLKHLWISKCIYLSTRSKGLPSAIVLWKGSSTASDASSW